MLPLFCCNILDQPQSPPHLQTSTSSPYFAWSSGPGPCPTLYYKNINLKLKNFSVKLLMPFPPKLATQSIMSRVCVHWLSHGLLWICGAYFSNVRRSEGTKEWSFRDAEEEQKELFLFVMRFVSLQLNRTKLRYYNFVFFFFGYRSSSVEGAIPFAISTFSEFHCVPAWAAINILQAFVLASLVSSS